MKITFKQHDFVTLPQEWIDSMPRHGACDEAIAELMSSHTVNCERDDSLRYLMSIGFDGIEQDDSDSLTSKVLWMALMDCRDNNSTEWYMGE